MQTTMCDIPHTWVDQLPSVDLGVQGVQRKMQLAMFHILHSIENFS
jgi:hypothetical protein